MRRTWIVLLAVLSASVVIEAQGFGIQAGFFEGKEKYRVGSDNKYQKYPNKFENGFQVGVFYEYDIPNCKGFGFGLGVNYGYLRDHDKDKDYSKVGSYYIKHDTTRVQQVIDVPVYLSWRVHIAKEAAFIFQTGPIFSFCLEDWVRTKATYQGDALSALNTDVTFDRIHSGSEATILTDGDVWPSIQTLSVSSRYKSKQYLDARIQPFNVMWNVGIGIQYQRYSLRFNYAWGLTNLFVTRRCLNDNAAYRLRDRKDEWTITVAYQFVPKKKKKA